MSIECDKAQKKELQITLLKKGKKNCNYQYKIAIINIKLQIEKV